MKAHYFQHVGFEGPAFIEDWLKTAGHDVSGTRLYESTEFPDIDTIDFLVVMGGPMSVNDDLPWLPMEKTYIRSVIDAGKPVLGVCLGAQLIASAMGAKVAESPKKEIGWFPIRAVETKSSFCFPDSMEVLHWHGESFDLPSGASRLAESSACLNQAFQIGRHVIGLQFHLEANRSSLLALVENGRDELIEAEFIQSEEEILGANGKHLASINAVMSQVLVYLTDAAKLCP